MKPDIPKAITDAITELRAECLPLAARLEAIHLAIENLSRVYGISGLDDAPAPFRQARVAAPAKAKAGRARDDGDASARRDTLLAEIARSDIGLSLSELRHATPKMDGKDRSTALQALKADGKITRAGNTWRAA